MGRPLEMWRVTSDGWRMYVHQVWAALVSAGPGSLAPPRLNVFSKNWEAIDNLRVIADGELPRGLFWTREEAVASAIAEGERRIALLESSMVELARGVASAERGGTVDGPVADNAGRLPAAG